MGRKERINRLREMWGEFLVAKTAIELLGEKLQTDPSFGSDKGWGHRDARAWNSNIEGTFLIRFYAVFEAALRDAWELKFRQESRPRMRDLLIAISARSNMSEAWHDQVTQVRLYRNSLVHDDAGFNLVVPLADAHTALIRYLSRLPSGWW